MKKMVLSLILAVMACAMMAQEHMTFKGVEINGPKKEFVEQLKEKGASVERARIPPPKSLELPPLLP